MKKQHHQAVIVRINDIKPHLNADMLELINPLGGYQVVVKKGEFKVGDLALYVYPDSVVPQTEPFKFIWENYLCEGGIVPEKRRRITVRKFRKEYSEGLLMPIKDFPELLEGGGNGYGWPVEGFDVSDILGIYHYNPPEPPVKGKVERGPTGPQKWPKSLKGWIYFLLHKIGINLNGNINGWDRESGPFKVPFYDVESYKNHISAFEENEEVTICEKIHGSNARFVFSNGKFFVGSRTLWKAPESDCIWRKAAKANPWLEEWCREHENFVVYGEVTPTQGGFEYGSKEPQIFIFDILSPDGEWLNHEEVIELCKVSLGLFWHWVPILYKGPFNLEIANELVGGPSAAREAKNIREGVVIRSTKERHVIGLGRLQLKLINPEFYLKENK